MPNTTITQPCKSLLEAQGANHPQPQLQPIGRPMHGTGCFRGSQIPHGWHRKWPAGVYQWDPLGIPEAFCYKGYAGCWLKKEKRALPVSPGSLAEAGGNLISEDSHMIRLLRLLFGFCGWFGVLLSPASTALNYQTSPNQLTKSSESGDHGLISPPAKSLAQFNTPSIDISRVQHLDLFLVHPSSTLILMWYFAFF